MKKIMVALLIVLVAGSIFTGAASAKAVPAAKETFGPLHQYMEKVLAEKLNLPLATVESEFAAGKPMYQIALDHGVAQADLQAFMLDVRNQALKAAVADGVITQAQADRMLQHAGYGMGYNSGFGMMSGSGYGYGYGMMGSGTGPCGGTGIPVGGGMMHHGGPWQQTNP